MKKYQREVFIAQPANVVFDFFADMTLIPKWAPEDFISVEREGSGPFGAGSQFSFVTKGANARSVFTWDVFDRPHELRFSSPRLNVGPGWVEAYGGYLIREAPNGVNVTAWLEPGMGGLIALVAPFARMRNGRILGKQLARVRAMLQSPASDEPARQAHNSI